MPNRITSETESAGPPLIEEERLRLVLAGGDLIRGLTSAEAVERLARYGPNDPAPVVRLGWRPLLRRQIESALILVLFAAMFASFALAEWLNGIAIAISIVASAGLGFAQEFRSERAIEALERLTALKAEVIRDGLRDEVSALEIVPGDLIIVGEGDTIPADALVVESHGLFLNEAVLTGEAQPVAKESQADGSGGLGSADRLSAGTTVLAGSGQGIVHATGRHTMLGTIFASLGEERRHETPLERRFEELGRRLVVVFLIITGALAVLGIAQGRDARLTVEMAVALAIGAVPEGLPAVATTSLAIAVRRLAKRRVLVRQLDAVETLGSTTIIVTDKTGTLTENRLAVRAVVLPSGDRRDFPAKLQPVSTTDGPEQSIPAGWEIPSQVILFAALCGEAAVEFDEEDGWHAHGDPSEAAISYAAAALGWHTSELRQLFPRVETTPFTAERKYMRTVHQSSDGRIVAVKGAPEQVHALARGSGEVLLEQARVLGEGGYRVLAVATGPDDEHLDVIGAIVLEDPLRADARDAVEACRAAGLRLMLATGDQLTTAVTVARESGLLDDDQEAVEARHLDIAGLDRVAVVARATHDQKEDIIRVLQGRGEVVVMLGDGVNDAPALRAADVGVAVGPNATDVAVQASQVVLADGQLSSLVEGIREGRQNARNLQRSIVYLLTASFATIAVISLGMLLDDDLPLGPLQILWLNLVVHVFPALALATGHEDGRMDGGPTRTFVVGMTWLEIACRASLIAIAAAVMFEWSGEQEYPLEQQQALVFATVAIALLGQSFLIGVPHPRLLLTRLRRLELWGAIAISGAFLMVALYVPFMRDALDLHALSWGDWVAISGAAFVAGNLTQVGAATLNALSRRRW